MYETWSAKLQSILDAFGGKTLNPICFTLRLIPALVILLLLAAPRVGAELAILSDGRSMKVAAWEVDEAVARLTLPGGGIVTIVASRLERIVDDEMDTAVPGLPPDLPIQPDLLIPDGSCHFSTGAGVIFSSPFDDWIIGLSAKHDVDPALVSAVVKAESNFRPSARSPKGAVGLMQLMPATAARFRVANRFDPVSSLDGGIRYLRWLVDRYSGNLERVLAAYNAGEGAVDRFGGIPPYRETQGYVRKILGFLSAGRSSGTPTNPALSGM